ncbi:MAG TPA: DUF3097 domain-containing protein [Propioniciclava sp.]|jgi:hypothetical protein|uniref:DUF3097 domain-containing protein n=1 Tax=Propioniciclava sp. TaxID=2038686 RepID=UPI002BA0132F|nr:DUF3097 domain-containing protein [Propioniciclava sp.]HRL48550.1 DUF3097 domain-containing protein [Propioniciclava sp.]HRL79080.1 DUF3097 domain-containing protein [Propioniciclava sp.]
MRVGWPAPPRAAAIVGWGIVNRYSSDVLAKGWQRANKPTATPTPVSTDLVLEEPTSGFVGAVVGWENGVVILEDRRGKRRSFPFGPNFWLDGQPIDLTGPTRSGPTARDTAQEYNRTHTASGSRVGPAEKAKVALPSRIYVEGRHDAELVEKVWGADLRHVGVVVEYLGGIDDLPAIVAEFAPVQGRRLGVLVDHLVPGTKESRIVSQVSGDYVFVTGHEFIDIWEAVKPERLGLTVWPRIPRGTDWKHGICAALGWPHATQADIATAWKTILGRVRGWQDLDPHLLTEVERLIDFVSADHIDRES